LLQKSLRLLEGTKKVVVGKIMKDVDKMKDGTQKKLILGPLCAFHKFIGL